VLLLHLRWQKVFGELEGLTHKSNFNKELLFYKGLKDILNSFKLILK